MSLNGSTLHGLLDPLHGSGCDGQEYSTVRPVAWGDGVAIVYCAWCGECGAADYELVGTLDPDPDTPIRGDSR